MSGPPRRTLTPVPFDGGIRRHLDPVTPPVGTIRRRLTPSPNPQWPTTFMPGVEAVSEGVQGTPSEPRRVAVSNVAEHQAMPILYGTFRVQCRPLILGVDAAGGITVAWLVGLGPIQAVDGYELSGHAAPIAGVTFETFLGAPNTTVSTALAALIASYAQKHPWWAMLIAHVDADSALYGGLPTATVWGRGRKDIYDPRTASTAYSANPALCCAHYAQIAEGCGYGSTGIDWTSVSACAEHCDFDPSGTDTRYRLGAALDSVREAREWLNELMRHARLAESYDQGLWKLLCESEGTAPVATIDDDWMLTADQKRGPLDIRQADLGPDEVKTNLTISHSEPTRGYEMYPQPISAPGVAEGYIRRLDDALSAPWIQSAAVAARLAETTMFEKLFDGRLSLACNRRALPLERQDVVWVKGPMGIEHDALTFDGATAKAVGAAGADYDLTTAGSFDIDFTCLSYTFAAYQVLLAKWHNSAGHFYGYGAMIDNTLGALHIYFGDAVITGAGPGDLRDGRLHRLRVSWSQNGRLIAWLDGVEIGNVAGGAAAATETDAVLRLGHRNGGSDEYWFNGRLSRVRIWNVARTAWEHWRDLRRTFATPYPAGLIADFTFPGTGATLADPVSSKALTLTATTWTTEGECYRVISCRPASGRARVQLELRELSPNSCASATVTSTGTLVVNRVSTKSSTTLPDATADPPAPTNLSLVVQSDVVAGATRYKILATWTKSSSGFVRGYRVTVVADATTRTILDGSRMAESAVIDVIEPRIAHTVSVAAVSTNGATSTALSGSTTPGSAAPSLSLSLYAEGHSLAPWQTKGGTSYKAAVLYTIDISLSSSDLVERIEVLQNGHVLGAVEKTCTRFAIGNGRYWTINDYPMSANPTFWGISANGGDTITARAVLTDGRIVDSAGLSLSASTYASYISSATAYARDLLAVASSERAFHSAVGSSPTCMRIPRTNATPDWSWAALDGALGTIGNGDAYVTITLQGTMPSTSYVVVLTAADGTPVWPSDKSTTTFRINRSGTTGALEVNWIAFIR